jgi:hypothetical protein
VVAVVDVNQQRRQVANGISLFQSVSLPLVNMLIVLMNHFKRYLNGAACIKHQCKKTTMLSCHRCNVNTGVEKMNDI